MATRNLATMPAAALLAVLGAAGCASTEQAAPSAASQAAERLSSGEILHVMHTLNMGELRQARLAMETSADPRVQDAAEIIIRDHTRSNQRIRALAQVQGVQLEPNPLSSQLERQAASVQSRLSGLAGTAFDRAYLVSQMQMHELALSTVRSELLPDAEAPAVREFLLATTPTLAMHRERVAEYHAALMPPPRG